MRVAGELDLLGRFKPFELSARTGAELMQACMAMMASPEYRDFPVNRVTANGESIGGGYSKSIPRAEVCRHIVANAFSMIEE